MNKKFKKIENASESYIFKESHRSHRYTYIYLFILMLSLEPADISVDESSSSISSDLYIYTCFGMSAPKNMHAQAQEK